MFRAMIVAAAMVVASPAFADPVRFAVTDIEGLETLQQEFGAFEEALEKSSGLEIELFPVSSRTAAVEALNSGKVELVLTGPAEYVVMKELADPKIVVGWQRPNYFAQIVTLTDGQIDNVSDLKGKTVTFGSVGSTSQHLGPSQVLADFGLGYNSDYKAQIISRNVAVEALIRGDIHAVGMNEGHLRRIRAAFPDVAFSVVARGRDLPNDILVARRDTDPAMVEKVRNAFMNDGKALMAAVITGEDNKKYEGGFFLTSIEDKNYDYVRSMYKTIGVSMNSFVGN
jgi:phosphonate transport system substrate-binding protein